MRHRKKLNHLGRTSSHRKAMLSNMASSLIIHKRIKTTLAKAKALRVYVEPLITKSKLDNTHSRRTVFSHLQNKEAVSELFRDVSVKVMDRPGGYTRILKLGNRMGDAAEICYIELVDYNETYQTTPKGEEDKKRTRRGRRKKSSDTVTAAAVAPAKAKPAESKVETTKEEVKEVQSQAATAPKETQPKAEEAKEVQPEAAAPKEVKAETTPETPEAETAPETKATAKVEKEAEVKDSVPGTEKEEEKPEDESKTQ